MAENGSRGRVLMIAKGGWSLASSRQQVHGWVPYLERAGFEVVVVCRAPDADVNRERKAARRVSRFLARIRRTSAWWWRIRRIAKLLQWADALYIQEVFLPPRVLRSVKAHGIGTIFNFADPIHLVGWPGARWHDRLRHRLIHERRFKQALAACQVMVVENELLGELAPTPGPEVVIIRAPFDTDRYTPLPDNDGGTVTVGWAGSASTLSYLEPLASALEMVANTYPNVEIALFGVADAGAELTRRLPLRVVAWDADREAHEVASFDIGISYVPENNYTRYRGTSKLIMYMCCGLPIVSSPFGIADQVIDDGRNGILARSESEWVDALSALIVDPALRQKLGREARGTALTSYSYVAYLPQISALLDAAVERRREHQRQRT